jgi:hypothetical protein
MENKKVMGFEDVFTAIVSGKGESYLIKAQQDFEDVCNKRVEARLKMTEAIIDFEIKKAQYVSNEGIRGNQKNELAIGKFPDEYRKMMTLIDVKKGHDIYIKKLEYRINTIKLILNTKRIF